MKTSIQVETIDRAKLLYEEKYVKGSYIYDDVHKKHLMIMNAMHGLTEAVIDPSTRAIHFTNSGMNDSEGTPIFASLSRNYGGDMLNDEVLVSWENMKMIVVYKPDCYAKAVGECKTDCLEDYLKSIESKVTGIHTVKEES